MKCGNIEYSSNIPWMSKRSTPQKTQLPSLKLFLISYFWFLIYRQNRSHPDTPSNGPEKQASGALSCDLLMEEPVSFCFQQHCCTDASIREARYETAVMPWVAFLQATIIPLTLHLVFRLQLRSLELFSGYLHAGTWLHDIPSAGVIVRGFWLEPAQSLTEKKTENAEEQEENAVGRQSTTKYCLERHRDLYPVTENTLLQSCSVC